MFEIILAKNLRKPEGITGWIVGTLLKLNMPLYRDIPRLLELKNGLRILEIGYGSGYGIKLINKKYNLQIDGIDYSETMYKKARRINKNSISTGKTNIRFGDFNKIDVGNETYDRVFLLNVIYFWDDLLTSIRKLIRILKTDGLLLIFMEGPERLMSSKSSNNDVFIKYPVEFVRQAIESAMDGNINVYEHKLAKGCYYIIGRKKGNKF